MLEQHFQIAHVTRGGGYVIVLIMENQRKYIITSLL